MARVLNIDSGKIRRWYRDVLSGFIDGGQSSIHENDLEYITPQTGEIKKISVPICMPENIGENMCIDEKQIGEDVYTIISNNETGKIAFVADTTISPELYEATSPIREELRNVKVINRDLAIWYKKFCTLAMPHADQVGDKFHVIQLLLDAEQAVRVRYRREIDSEKRKAFEEFKAQEQKRKQAIEAEGKKFKGKKFVLNEKILGNGETPSQILARGRYLLYKFPHQWTNKQKERSSFLFDEFPELETAYQLSCEFRTWFSKDNIGKHELKLEQELYQWYENVEIAGIVELMNFSSTVERNQEYIENYFRHNGSNNAKAENKNGKIKQFINSNQGTRDRDFFFFRLKKYYAEGKNDTSSTSK